MPLTLRLTKEVNCSFFLIKRHNSLLAKCGRLTAIQEGGTVWKRQKRLLDFILVVYHTFYAVF